MIGSISVISIDERNCSYQVGYGIGYDFWNMGLMSEVPKAVLAFLFDEVGVERIVIKNDVKNPESAK